MQFRGDGVKHVPHFFPAAGSFGNAADNGFDKLILPGEDCVHQLIVAFDGHPHGAGAIGEPIPAHAELLADELDGLGAGIVGARLNFGKRAVADSDFFGELGLCEPLLLA